MAQQQGTSQERFRPKRAGLVVNTRSRVGEQAFSAARGLLRDLGVPLASTYPLRDPGELSEAVRASLHDGCDLLVLGGGDGTVSSVVDDLAGSDMVLGLLPLGTANDFARTLTIPSDLRQACENIARGKVVDVDLGLVGDGDGDDYFVNVASAGVSVGVTQALSPWLKKRAGALAYPVASIRAFLRHRPFSAWLTFPDDDHPAMRFDRLLQVAVGNGRFYGGGMVVSPQSGIDDKTLDVYAIELGRGRDLIGVVRYLRSGDFISEECVTHVRTTCVDIETVPLLSMNVDGEVTGRTPARFRVARNVLKVLVPEESDAARLDAPR